MANPFLPWEHYPSLTARRLQTIATILRTTRDRVIDISDPDEGDSNWSIGCRVYDRTIFKLRDASIPYEWLRVLAESQRLRLTFAIGSVPVKLYKGDPEDIPERTLVRSFSELRQMRLAFEQEGVDISLSIRIAVETDATGRTTTITLVEVDEAGEPTRVYEIPLPAPNLLQMKAAPIDLPAPRIERIKPTKKEREVADDAQPPAADGKP